MKAPSSQKLVSLVRQEIAAIAGYVPGEQPQDAGWTKLNTNENPYSPSASVVNAITAACEGRSLAKYPDPFANQFRAQAAEVLGIDPRMILCGNGSDDLLTIYMFSVFHFVTPPRPDVPYHSIVPCESKAVKKRVTSPPI